MTRFYLQTQAPAGNWTDHLGAEQQTCIDHGQYLIDEQHYAANQVRVVERVDTVVWTPKAPTKAPTWHGSKRTGPR